LLQESFAYLEKVFTDSWKASEDPALRDELWRSQANLANLRKHITTVLNNGKMAQAEIDQLSEKRKRFGIV
jgi:predicted XRE-type DNA-binding protein